MKKKLLILSVTAVMLSGCQVTKLTKEQNAIIGTEIANYLMANDPGYDDDIMLPGEIEKLDQETNTKDSSTENTTENTAPATNTSDEETIQYSNYLFNNSKYSIRLNGYKVSNSYQYNPDYVERAKSGYRFIILNCSIKNKTARKISLNYFANSPSITLSINGGKGIAAHNFSSLPTDLTTLIEDFNGSDSFHGVILFEVPASQAKLASTGIVTSNIENRTSYVKLN